MARRETLLDLQFRGVEGKDAKATLYLGLTALMGIRAKRGASGPARFRLVPHAGKEAGADGDPALLKLSTRMLELSKWLPIDNLAGSWADVEAYLNRLIPRIKERWTGVEGAVQSTLEVTRSVAVIDREVVLGYKNDSTRKSIKGSVTKRYNEALREPPSAEDAPWWKGKHPFGNELDLLCVDGNGRLLLIELKPASATAGIAWSPAQVSVYRDLFLRWVAQEEEEKARDTLRRMLEQRMGPRSPPEEKRQGQEVDDR